MGVAENRGWGMAPLLERLSPISPSPTSVQVAALHVYMKHMHVYVYTGCIITNLVYRLGILGITSVFLS
jgi:hypothetical protein